MSHHALPQTLPSWARYDTVLKNFHEINEHYVSHFIMLSDKA